MEIAIIKYNAGNIKSVSFALERLGVNAMVTDDPGIIAKSDKVIFPGVGQAASAMQNLKQKGLDTVIKELKQPVLGICLGMQLLCSSTEEGNTPGLNIFKTNVVRFNQPKVPHIGWNKVDVLQETLFKQTSKDIYCYFVHSYYANICEQTASITEYGERFSSSLQSNNFYGVQFHPEKSSAIGEQILKNFLAL